MFKNARYLPFLFIIAGTFLFKPLFAVGEAGAIFLLIPPSPTMNAMGGIGVSFPSYDIYSGYYNPANPVLPMGLSYQKSKYDTPWLPNLADDIVLANQVETAGIQFKKSGLYFSVSRYNMSLGLGEQVRQDEWGNVISVFYSDMNTTAISYSVGLKFSHLPLRISVGRTDKKTAQNLIQYGVYIPADSLEYSSHNDFYDWGYLISFPMPLKRYRSGLTLNLIPSAGYSQSNIGGDVTFISDSSSTGDPSPRFARFGISGRLELNSSKGKNLLSFSYAREAGDLLVELFQEDDATWHHRYQSGLGDIDIKRHILKGSADDNVTLYQGTEIGLLNAYFVRKGHMQDLDGQIDLKTSGYGYNLSGFLSLFSLLTKDPSFSNLSEYINIRYNYALDSTVDSDGPRDNTVYKELTFSLNNPQKFLSFLGKKNVTWFGGYLVSDLWHPPDQGAYSSLQGFDVGVELPNLFGGGGLITGFRFAQMGFALNGVEHFFNTQLSINFHLNYLRTYLAKPFQLFQFQFLLGAEFGYLINIDSRTTLCNSEGECEFSTASISGHDWRQYYNGNYEDVGLIAGMRIPLSARLFIGTHYYHGFTNVLNPVDAQNQSLTAGLYIKI